MGALRTAARVTAVGIAYFAAARLGLSLAFAAEQVTVVWPPTGIALAALLVLGRLAAPGIWLGALAANVTIGEPLVTALGIATGNTLEALVATWLLRRARFNGALERLRDVLALLGLGAAAAPVVSATIGVTSLCATGLQPWTTFPSLWRVWWLGDAMGVLLAGPLLLTWASGRRLRWPSARVAEAALLFLVLAGVATLVFTDGAAAMVGAHRLVYAVFPFVMWAALRFGQRETATALLLVEVLAIVGSVAGRGPFMTASTHDSLVLLQLFMAVTAATALLLGAAIAERRTAECRRAADFLVTQALNESPTLATAAPRILAGIRESLGWDVGAIWIPERGGERLRCLDVSSDPGLARTPFVEATRERSFEPGIGVPGRVWQSGQPLWISDVVHDPNFPRAPLARAQGLHAAFAFPIRLGTETLGVIEFFSREIRPPDEDLLKMFATVGAQIGQFMDRRRAEEERATLLAQLEQALQAKDEFLAILGHELRNPLAPLRNAAEILGARAAGDPAIERIQRIIERQVRHMVRLVDDLLDVSRIARGRVELRRERVSVAEVVARAVEAARPLFEERGQELAVAVPSEPIVVDVDPVRLEQVLGNLLHNAARYTEAQGHIAVEVVKEDGEAVFRIRDDGIGIAPEMLERVFELFVQGERPRSRTAEGLGIGLTLVRNLVELHGGRVEARSEGPGRGSEFVVRLPLAGPGSPAGAEDRPPEPARTPAAARRILLVDDNVDAAESLAEILRAGGHEVAVVYDGAAALARAAEDAFDFVLLDIALPDDLDGYEVARRLRREGTLRGATLIAVTGFGQDEDRRRAADAGFDHHLVKPVDPEAVRRLLAAEPTAVP
jgi:signal transduction histidine kinase/integral membrane sensor domain MASE1/ActR/RegA family two-component response regulator